MKRCSCMYNWLHSGAGSNRSTPNQYRKALREKRRVAVFDATNTTIARRRVLMDRAKKEKVMYTKWMSFI